MSINAAVLMKPILFLEANRYNGGEIVAFVSLR